MDYTIEIKGISHDFSHKRVLNNINLQVGRGEILGMLGPSGAGKTTLIKILTGQLHQSEGTASLLGIDTRSLNSAIYHKIGTMMDNYGLYERLSAYDNLKFYADIYQVPKESVNKVLNNVGLYEARKTSVSKLSKGMRSRLSLARAVMNEAEILFLDEPTTGLDPATTREIHKMLIEEKNKGRSIFLTTHNMFEAESICDNVALLNQGELVEYGKPQDICKRYNHLNKLRIHLKDGIHMELANGSQSAASVGDLLENDMIATIHSTEPTLESVFIELTGREFN